MAIWITLAGLLVTVVINVVFMPRFSYWASAFAHLASYLTMFILCAALGAKYYPIPYKWGRILLVFVFMGAAYGLMVLADSFIGGGASGAAGAVGASGLAHGGMWLRMGLNTVAILAYLACCGLLFGRSLLRSLKRSDA